MCKNNHLKNSLSILLVVVFFGACGPPSQRDSTPALLNTQDTALQTSSLRVPDGNKSPEVMSLRMFLTQNRIEIKGLKIKKDNPSRMIETEGAPYLVEILAGDRVLFRGGINDPFLWHYDAGLQEGMKTRGGLYRAREATLSLKLPYYREATIIRVIDRSEDQAGHLYVWSMEDLRKKFLEVIKKKDE